MEGIFTSESVTEGHPDKVADQIADAILDAYLEKDKYSRVACNVAIKNNTIFIGGEITSAFSVDYEAIVRQVLNRIGYSDEASGFDIQDCRIILEVSAQSPDIAQGVDRQRWVDQGAGDQGIVYGYACKDTEVLMPAPIYYAHKLVERQAILRKSGKIPWLLPDAKSQVSLRYENDEPVEALAVVFSTQHTPKVNFSTLIEVCREEIIKFVLKKEWLTHNTFYYINSTGRFVVGGPLADMGLTGRKTAVDAYGGMARDGGGSFSGKDPSKVDRSAAYMARYIAKNIVACGLASRVELQLAYAIGIAEPVAIHVETFGSAKESEAFILEWIKKHFDLTPYGMIKALNLLRPIYFPLAAYGHFGRINLECPWERISEIKL